ncbi:hypothetical protein ACF064_28265 [Streptomyces sp. NPDC015492]|uniref:hypothetical protein n=1 Tax=Streptomyces sp. NPDC015492 TaxID=3364958 RepID=UPI0036F7014F
MPQNESPPNESPQHERFEDALGAILHRTGDGFAADDRRELVEGGLRRGRRRLVRRRLAVGAGVLALAAVTVGGVYGGSLLSPSGDASSVAAPPRPTSSVDPVPGKQKPAEARIPVADIAAVLKSHLPEGKWEVDGLDGFGQSLTAVYDEGKGRAAVTVGLFRAGPGEAGEDQIACPDKVAVPFDDCTEETLQGGARLMILQGYEYPDKRVDTKAWRAVLLTRDGFLLDVSEYNAAAEKGAPVSRENPPFTPAQLKALVTADDWGPLTAQLPAYVDRSGAGGPGGGADTGGTGGTDAPRRHVEPESGAVQSTLRSLLPPGLRVTAEGGGGEYAYLVVDDGKGKSLVQINVQQDMANVADDLFGSGDVTTLPDGRRVKLTRQPGEKGGEGVVWWTADTMTPEGFRVVVSAFNAGTQHEAATRAEPALTMDQLKSIALSLRWQTLPMK